MLRIGGAISGCAAIAIGLYSLITSAFNPRLIINAVYQVIFGILILIAEARWQGLLKHFKFLTHFLGLGMFYVFVGGLALNDDWWKIALAVLLLAVGIIYLLLGMACRTMTQPSFNQSSRSGASSSSPFDQSDSGAGAEGKKSKEQDAITDLKKKAAHAAVDHAIDSGTNPFA